MDIAASPHCTSKWSLTDVEDAMKGFSSHSDQERLLETSLYQALQVHWEVVSLVAVSKK